MELLAKQPAEHSNFETEINEETEKEEHVYNKTLQYFMHDRYPEGASKQEKGVIWKCYKHYRANCTEFAVVKITKKSTPAWFLRM